MVTRAQVCGAALLFTACAAPLAQPAMLVGTWEYRQANPARPSGVDAEGERLVIRRAADGRLVADYFGLERTGDHGLFYSAVAATGLNADPDGTLRLTVPGRRLFRTRPASVAQAATLETAGSTAFELSLSGRLANGNLVVSCSAGGDSCPDSQMVFRRVSTSAR